MRANGVCSACSRTIDGEARICPYCGANPTTGERFDATEILQAHFTRKQDLPVHETVLEFFRKRQSLVVGLGSAVLLALAFFVLQFLSARNAATAAEAPAIPLTEVADLSNRPSETEKIPIPNLEFQHDGNARSVRTLLMEPGAVAPPPPVTPPSALPAQGSAQTQTASPSVAFGVNPGRPAATTGTPPRALPAAPASRPVAPIPSPRPRQQ